MCHSMGRRVRYAVLVVAMVCPLLFRCSSDALVLRQGTDLGLTLDRPWTSLIFLLSLASCRWHVAGVTGVAGKVDAFRYAVLVAVVWAFSDAFCLVLRQD